MYKNLKSYIEYLEENGELIRIKEEVSNNLEIAEITDRISSQSNGGKALLFENTPTAFPVLTNMFGSDRRIAMALGVNDVNDFSVRLDSLFGDAMSPKRTLMDKLKMLPLLQKASQWMPKDRKSVV